MIVITDIKEIVTNYEGKATNFLIKLEGESVHMKCDDAKTKEQWFASLNGLREIYKGRKVLDWDDDRRSHKEDVDIRLASLIMDEQEGRSF